MIEHLFVDFDDTVYDTRGNAQIALGELYDALHFERHYASLEQFTSIFWPHNDHLWREYAQGNITRQQLIIDRFRHPLAQVGVHLSDDESVAVSDKFLSFTSVKTGVVADAHEVMRYLHSKYRIHMTSNGFHEVQLPKLRACGLQPYFDTIILSEDGPANKPSPLYFDYALQRAGASRHNTLVIGDNPIADMQGAHDSHLPHIWFDRGRGIAPQQPPTHTITRLTQLYDLL